MDKSKMSEVSIVEISVDFGHDVREPRQFFANLLVTSLVER
jgi:hypothetical protein